MKIINKYKKGFTLVETLVAIAVLVIAVTGPMAIAQSALRSAYFAKDQTTAFYLAQDAMEYIKNIRDRNFVTQYKSGGASNWDEDIKPHTTNYTVDTTTGKLDLCSSVITGCNKNNPLKIDSNGRYGHNGENSKFYRTIKIDTINSDEMSVTVTVGWNSGVIAGDRTVVVKENIYKWFDTFTN